MSMDFRKNTYRPNRPDSRFRTSYALMSQWMMQLGNRSNAPVEGYVSQPNFPTKHSAGNVYGRRSRMVNSDGAPSPYNPDAAQLAAMDESIPPHLRFSTNNGYDDFHKSYQQVSQQFPNKHFPVFGPPKLRHGRAGGSWRHVKEVLQAGGRRIVFVDEKNRPTEKQIFDRRDRAKILYQPGERNIPVQQFTDLRGRKGWSRETGQ
ncbi:uncharacterized protein [Magallana gigas]|uniref:uncharacterized protein isoform X4 n=1 Tax=Magallana gigas TaxID=29159 RepID=UPI00333E55FE